MPEGIGVQIKPNTSFTLRQTRCKHLHKNPIYNHNKKYIHKLR